jgi:hypothetical protein
MTARRTVEALTPRSRASDLAERPARWASRRNWSFAYVGEDPERWARETGTSVRNTAQYNHGDPQASFDIARRATSAYRASDAAQSQDFLDPDKKDA